jgi:hypothetical protein
MDRSTSASWVAGGADRLCPRRGLIEHVGVKAGHVHGVGLDEPQPQRIGGLRAVPGGQGSVAGGVHADVQHGGGAAEIGVFGAGADGDQGRGAKVFQNTGRINAVALGNGADRRRRQGHGLRHGHIQPDQPLQAFGTPAMRGGLDQRGRRDKGEFGLGIVFLHCGIL